MGKIERMENCVIVGAGKYGRVYAEYLKEKYNVLGFIDDNIELRDKDVLGNFDFLVNNLDKSINVFIPLGNNELRSELLKRVIQAGFKTPNFIHKDSNIHSSVGIGKCVYILPGVNVMPLSTIGDFVLISVGVNISHHTKINEGCFFSYGVNVGASIILERNVFCGAASTIMTGVKNVGENSLIGAGAIVVKDVPDYAIVVGNPAKILKYKEKEKVKENENG